MVVQLQRRAFTVDEFYKMAAAGIFSEDDRVELLDGEIVQMTPIGSRHAGCVKRLVQIFTDRLGHRALVSVQDPIRLSERSEPQPDLALLAPREDFYASAHPGPQDVLLLIEVAESSAAVDRRLKLPLYARAAIREVWLVDLLTNVLQVYRGPSPGGYAESQRLRRGRRITPLAFPDVQVSVEEILT